MGIRTFQLVDEDAYILNSILFSNKLWKCSAKGLTFGVTIALLSSEDLQNSDPAGPSGIDYLDKGHEV